MLHLLAEYPVHAAGTLIPIQSTRASTTEIVAELLKKDYSIEVTPHTKDGKVGYLDQNGRFFMYRFVSNPKELGDFMTEIGAGEDVLESILRSLR